MSAEVQEQIQFEIAHAVVCRHRQLVQAFDALLDTLRGVAFEKLCEEKQP